MSNNVTNDQKAEFAQKRGLMALSAESGGDLTPVVIAICYWLDTLLEKIKSVKKAPTPKVTVAKAEVEKDREVWNLTEKVVSQVRQVIFDAIRNDDPRVSFLIFDALEDIRKDVKVHRDLVMAGMNIKVPTDDNSDNVDLPWDDLADVDIALESLKSYASMIPTKNIPADYLTDKGAIEGRRWKSLASFAEDSDASSAVSPDSNTKADPTKVTTWNLNGENIEVTGLAWLAVFHASDYSNIITNTELEKMIEDQTGKSYGKYQTGESFTVTVPSGTLTGTIKNKA